MSRQQHRLHGDPARFESVAKLIADTFGNSIKYIADVAGGQGLLTRILNKKYNYTAETIDPRGFTLKGVTHRQTLFTPDQASFYDLIVGVHPDGALKAIAESAKHRPTLMIPCCNCWTPETLDQEQLLSAIEDFYFQQNIQCSRVSIPFKGPKNIGLLTT